ncbi:MAG: signal peptidase I [Candidatus Zixiibacteriota bacterium]
MRRRGKSKLKPYALTIGIALVIGMLLRTYVVQGYRIPSRSMEDTLLDGDFLLVYKLVYHFSEPKVGDIIVFKHPFNPSKTFIKRIVASEGQIVEIVNKRLYVDGEEAETSFPSRHIDHQILPAEYSNRDNFGPFEVPKGQYCVLGDNRDNSQDSRDWGFLDRGNIKGKALVIYFSWAPDSNAPQWSSPYIGSFFEILFYDLIHFPSRVRWERVLTAIR